MKINTDNNALITSRKIYISADIQIIDPNNAGPDVINEYDSI